MNKKIKRIYISGISLSVVIIILSILQLIFKIVDIPIEIPISLLIFVPVGLVSLIIDMVNYYKN